MKCILTKSTKILMADGSLKRITDIKKGDKLHNLRLVVECVSPNNKKTENSNGR